LTFAEREEIALLNAAETTVTAIAAAIGRNKSTVSRELRRIEQVRVGVRTRVVPYKASTAQAHADTQALRPKQAKLATNLRLRARVQDDLKENWSPEQISHRLVKDFPDDAEMRVSHETIYQSLYVQARGGLKRELTAHLRTGRALRKPRRRSTERRGRIPDMVNISARPAEVADRAVPGHWEGDLILGSTTSGSAVGTLVERTTGFTMLLHLPEGHTAEAVAAAMITKMAELPDLLRRSLTWDQGMEMSQHKKIADATGLSIYFCDPHSPWQRPSNENTNGLLRQYLPKGTDLSFHGPGLLDNYAAELNGRPRKRLDWDTPAERLHALLSEAQPSGVAPTA
jgi:IS30 family transposase